MVGVLIITAEASTKLLFLPSVYRETQFLLHKGRNLDFSVLVSKTPDVFMFSVLYIFIKTFFC